MIIFNYNSLIFVQDAGDEISIVIDRRYKTLNMFCQCCRSNSVCWGNCTQVMLQNFLTYRIQCAKNNQLCYNYCQQLHIKLDLEWLSPVLRNSYPNSFIYFPMTLFFLLFPIFTNNCPNLIIKVSFFSLLWLVSEWGEGHETSGGSN